MHEATRRVLSVVLQKIEGFSKNGKSVMICATNRKSDLDAALISRFDLSIKYENPDDDTRRKVFKRYAQQLSDIVDAGIKAKTDLKQRVSVEDFVKCILNFDPNDTQCKEMLFTIKVEIFETEKVKQSTDKEKKSKLRSAQTPLELLVAYNEFDD